MERKRTDFKSVKWQEKGTLKLLIVVGTRPEIIRLSEVIKKCRSYFDVILCHTGQNYDYNLNGIFFRDLGLEAPEVYLDSVGQDLGFTMGNIIGYSYELMDAIRPFGAGGYQFLPVSNQRQASSHSHFSYGGREPV